MATAIAEKMPDANLPAKEINVGQPVPVATPAPSISPREQMIERISKLSRARQLQLILSLSAAVALIIAIMMWSSKPTYKLLYGNLSDKASGEIADVLKQKNIPYQLDDKTGQVLVPPDKVHEVRIALAAQGLPHSDGGGFEMMDRQPGFGSSQFMEMARYNHAMEGELGRTVSGMAGVEGARVHLAIPKQSVFIRDRQEPSASVLVSLVAGKTLSEDEVAAIVHVVSGAIPNLKPDKVTVVDQSGKMLTKREVSGDLSLSAAQFDFKRKLEEYYILRIERIVMPVVGFEAVRAQVDADVDFSITESTQETFNPDLPSVRSEQTIEEESKGGDGAGGVPGALTNQPPQAGAAPEQAKGGQGAGGGGEAQGRKSKRSTYNYELDKTISHTKQAPGNLRRLSVAVVVDDKIAMDGAGVITHTALAPEEVERLASLVREAVGYNAQRGDSVTVINAAFQGAPPVPLVPPIPIWEQTWVIDIAKQAMGVFAVLMVLLIMVRPVVKAWTIKEEEEPAQLEAAAALPGPEGSEGQVERDGLSPDDWQIVGKTDEDYEKMLVVLRKLVTDDPKLVAQVIRTWVAVDESSS